MAGLNVEITAEMRLRQHQRDRLQIASRLLGDVDTEGRDPTRDRHRARVALARADALLQEAGDPDQMIRSLRFLQRVCERIGAIADEYPAGLEHLSPDALLAELQRRVLDMGVATQEGDVARTRRMALACAMVLAHLDGAFL